MKDMHRSVHRFLFDSVCLVVFHGETKNKLILPTDDIDTKRNGIRISRHKPNGQTKET